MAKTLQSRTLKTSLRISLLAGVSSVALAAVVLLLLVAEGVLVQR